MRRARIRSALESTGIFPLPVVNLVLVFALVGLVLPLYWWSPIVAIAFGVVFFVGPSIGMGAAWWARVLDLAFRASGRAAFGSQTTKMVNSRATLVASKVKQGNQQQAATPVVKVALFRILGNDLPPRHQLGQTLDNLRFTLEHEAHFPGVQKKWILNRIRDPEIEAQLIFEIQQSGQEYVLLPFDTEEYKQVGWDFDCLPSPHFLFSSDYQALDPEQKSRLLTAIYRKKNLYLMNNNGARNVALSKGRDQADWIFVFDGNSFLPAAAWPEISRTISVSDARVLAIPMARVTNNAKLLDADFSPESQEEPQLAFRCDFGGRFNEAFPYGRRPKVELMWHLGIPGPWDRWKSDPWDQTARPKLSPGMPYIVAGWVARLNSGNQDLERSGRDGIKKRGLEREKAIRLAVDTVDLPPRGATGPASLYSRQALSRLGATTRAKQTADLSLKAGLVNLAEKAFQAKSLSVKDKTGIAPSGDASEYYSVAPYWWPNSDSDDGLPYTRRDGARAPGTELFSAGSERFDRSHWQLTVDRTVTLILSWATTGLDRFAEKAAQNLRCWFIEPETRMMPSLRFSQVIPGRGGNKGRSNGIIEFKDIWYLLDAVKLLEDREFMSDANHLALKAWASDYLAWLMSSEIGREEMASKNNHGTFFDLQVLGLQHYLDDLEGAQATVMRALSRVAVQFGTDGEQHHEEARSIPRHYVSFNLQGFLNILLLARRAGVNVGSLETEPLDRLERALARAERQGEDSENLDSSEDFDPMRLLVARAFLSEIGDYKDTTFDTSMGTSFWMPRPDDGIPLMWQLALGTGWAEEI